MSTKILGNMPFWSQFAPDIKPPKVKRGVVKPIDKGSFDVTRTGEGLYSDLQEILTADIDISSVTVR